MAGELTRRDELAAGLQDVRTRIERACSAAGRDPSEITLIVVTKTFPASDVGLLAGLGVTDVGESRHQEAGPKVAECAGLPVRWHFVGQLQTNKAAAVAGYSSVVHSVDRVRLVNALSRGAATAGRPVECFVQVSLDEAPGRGGASGRQILEVADRVAEAESLQLAGVMAVAPLGVDPNDAFTRLTELAELVQTRHPAALSISAGMSGDFEAAISHGATHLRVGSAILGKRPPRV
ncbi:MAG TPA: YggS family pyridoxal phosphate-dependent enzyme [Jiangellaceae bacterium]